MQRTTTRKLRLMQAMQLDVLRPQINASLPLSIADIANASTSIAPGMRSKTFEDKLMNTMEMKLKILENWEVTKFNAIERLALEVEALQEMEEMIEQREIELEKKGVNINQSPAHSDSNKKNHLEQNIVTPTSTQIIKRPRLLTDARNGNSTQQQIITNKPLTWRNNNIQIDYVKTERDSEEVTIGPNGTKVPRTAMNAINWSLSGAGVTRKLLMEVFDRETLAFHTLTGKPSPAFMDCDKPHKNQLDPGKVADIIHIITQNLHMTPKEVRAAITTKCADENKMFRQREKKRQSQGTPEFH